jgi:hypothetical protein
VKCFPKYRHLNTGIDFFVIGATDTSTSKRVFICRETPQGRDRMFEIEGFDVPFVEREALYLTLLKREKARKKAEDKIARGKRRQLEARNADEENENLEATPADNLRPPWEFIPEGMNEPLPDDEQDSDRIV